MKRIGAKPAGRLFSKVSTTREILKNRLYCDLTLKMADGTEIKTHKFLLSEKSQYFYDLLKSEEGSTLMIDSKHESAVILQVIKYLYGEEVTITEENALKMFVAASDFLLHDLMEVCADSLIPTVTFSNVLKILEAIEGIHGVPEIDTLKDKCHDFMKENFEVIIKQKEWEHFLSTCVMSLRSWLLALNDSTKGFGYEAEKIPQPTEWPPVNHLLKTLFNKKVLCDVDLVSKDGKVVQAHKNVLSARLTVFEAMFTNDTLEAKNNRVIFSDMDFETLQEFIRFIYCDEVEELDKVALPLLFAADKYNMSDLKMICEFHLSQNIDKHNVIDILVAATQFDFIDPVLKQLCKQFIRESLEKIIDDPDWLLFIKEHPEIFHELIRDWIVLSNEIVKFLTLHAIISDELINEDEFDDRFDDELIIEPN